MRERESPPNDCDPVCWWRAFIDWRWASSPVGVGPPRMSLSHGGASEDSGTENPLAVYVRNLPIWFLEDGR